MSRNILAKVSCERDLLKFYHLNSPKITFHILQQEILFFHWDVILNLRVMCQCEIFNVKVRQNVVLPNRRKIAILKNLGNILIKIDLNENHSNCSLLSIL